MRVKTWQLAALPVVALLLGSLLLPAQKVEHARTAAECQAEHDLWSRKLRADQMSMDGHGARRGPDKIPAKILNQWSDEMMDCMSIDPDAVHSKDYLTLASMVGDVEQARMQSFLMRHNLYQQFLDEDEEGKR